MEEDYVMIPGSGTKKIIRDVKKEIETAFLDYSMSVIVSRALPDVRDGLKPVHRRILYTMHERGNDPSHPYRKSADTVGAVPVSYTHLDVYKRQRRALMTLRPFLVLMRVRKP